MRLVALLLGLLVAGTARAQTGDAVVAQRGTVTITVAAVRAMLEAMDPDQRARLLADPQALGGVVRDRLLQAAVLDEAKARQWDARPEVIARAVQAHDAAIADSYVTSVSQPDPAYPSEAEVQAAYDENKNKLVVPRQYKLAQIFLQVAANAPRKADDDAHARAGDLKVQASRPKADFAALARTVSDDKRSAAGGGKIGWAREDQLLPPIRAAVTGMVEGAVSDPVRMADGWHVLKLEATRPAAPASLADSHDTLVRALRQARQQQAARTYLDGLLAREPIRVNEIALGTLTR